MCAALLSLSISTGAAQDTNEGAATREDRRDLKVALQLYTVRDVGPFEERLALAAATGYRAVELPGDHGLDADTLAARLEAHGLAVTSAHVELEALRTSLEEVVAFHRRLGNDTVVVAWLPSSQRPSDPDGWRALGRELDALGARLRREGMQLGYHNHDFEMAAVGGRPVLDLLFEGADPENLSWQADVAWIDRGGRDPATMLRRHADRLLSIHAKDNAPPHQGEAEGGFADVGYGVLDWEEILPVAVEADVAWFIVEHDQPADAERTLRRSLGFLRDELAPLLGAP